MRIFKRLLKLILLVAAFGMIYSFGVATFENIAVDQMISEFKARANTTPSHVSRIAGVEVLYFEVPRETSNGEDNNPAFSDANKTWPGIKGDILVTRESPFPHLFGIHQFISYYFGGHAALVIGPDQIVEATGMGVDLNEMIATIAHRGFDNDNTLSTHVVISNNYWMERVRSSSDPAYDYYNGFFRNTFLTLRVRGDEAVQNENIDVAVEYAIDKYQQNAVYNFLFFLDTKYKYYCTDLVSRAYEQVYQETGRKIRINDDGFITSVHDLILSKDTYITIYKENVGDVQHVYYLADV